jgi:Ca2+-binding RTX toxin-like protein
LPSGTVLVGDSGAFKGVIGIDPATGKQSEFSSNLQSVNSGSAFYEIPVDILRTPDGSLTVADQNAFGDGGLVGVDPVTGKQSEVSSNTAPVNAVSGYFSDPFQLALGTDGRIVVADPSAFGGACTEGCGGLIAVDRDSGSQQMLSSNTQPANAATLPYENPLGVAVVPLRCEGRPATLMGTPGADRIEGTGGRDVIAAQAGKDRVISVGGNDIVCAGGGADTVKGGKGADRLLGERGNDRLLGGDGKDNVIGGGGKDKLLGNAGKDRLSGGRGADVLKGGGGRDKLKGGPGRDKLRK